jgi:hypothetical protein
MRFTMMLLVCLLAVSGAVGQQVEVRTATPIYMPTRVDSNSPAYWYEGQLHILNSANAPLLSTGSSQFYEMETMAPAVDRFENMPMWIEAAWLDERGNLFGYYHHEPGGVCPILTAPRIGAVLSRDGGASWIDLGIILESGDAPDCNAQNGFFAGGHGDFSIAVDGRRRLVYFYFTNYGGDVSQQGIAVARMTFADRFTPAGSVWKYYDGNWTEPGLRGLVTPILPTTTAWQRANTDSFWGPSIHWNRHLESWVMLLNRACCSPRWPQEGIYISFNANIQDPRGWSAPRKIISDVGFEPGWYPQILGTATGETDRLAGQVARLYIHGVSRWELVFQRADGLAGPPQGPAPQVVPAPTPVETDPLPPPENPPGDPMGTPQ